MNTKRDRTRARTTDDIERKYSGIVNNVVIKETGKGLSTNDFTNSYKKMISNASEQAHTHSNLSILNKITDSNLSGSSFTTLFSGESTEDITLSSTDYDFLIVGYGNDTCIDTKVILPSSKQIYLSLDISTTETIKGMYQLNDNTLTKLDDAEITIYTVIAMKGVDG